MFFRKRRMKRALTGLAAASSAASAAQISYSLTCDVAGLSASIAKIQGQLDYLKRFDE